MVDRRYRERGGELPAASIISSSVSSNSCESREFKLSYVRKHEVCRPSSDRDKCCRVLSVSEYQVLMLLINLFITYLIIRE